MIDLSRYENKNILIVGGGTSTLDVKWENTDYDHLWTCNDFFLEDRVLNQEIDLYLLAYTTDLSNDKLIDKLKHSNTTVFYEPIHYRGKQNDDEFKRFVDKIDIKVHKYNTPKIQDYNGPGLRSGAVFRLILLALASNASKVHFVGFDGFNEQFNNVHAFTKHRGLKPTDLRRTWKGTPEAYCEVFEDAYSVLAQLDTNKRLQNLGEGFDYNLGSVVSKKYFPLDKKLYEKLR